MFITCKSIVLRRRHETSLPHYSQRISQEIVLLREILSLLVLGALFTVLCKTLSGGTHLIKKSMSTTQIPRTSSRMPKVIYTMVSIVIYSLTMSF